MMIYFACGARINPLAISILLSPKMHSDKRWNEYSVVSWILESVSMRHALSLCTS